jgi:hypothetical protein
MVFIQQKYEEALVDLYFFRAESAWTQFDNNKRPAVDEAIAGTSWVAQQNGVTYSEEQIQEKFLEQLDAQLNPVASEFKREFASIDEKLDEYIDAFVSALKEYYLDPNTETFENVIEVSYQFDQSSDNMVIESSHPRADTCSSRWKGCRLRAACRGKDCCVWDWIL